MGEDIGCTGEAAPKESNVHPLRNRKYMFKLKSATLFAYEVIRLTEVFIVKAAQLNNTYQPDAILVFITEWHHINIS